MTIIFDQYGYTDGTAACANLCYNVSDTPTIWIHDVIVMYHLPVFRWEKETKKALTLESALASGNHPIITYIHKGGNPPKRARVYHLNKEGLALLCKCALLQGRKKEEAMAILKELNVEVDSEALAHLTKEEEPTKEVKAKEKETIVTEPTEPTDIEENDDTNSLVLATEIVETTKLEEIKDTSIYSWQKSDVILSKSFANHCGVAVRHLNQRIRKLKASDSLVEGIDFIYLDQKVASAWCVVEKVGHVSENEIRCGLYLLTQVGVNNLAKHLNNERAAAHSDGVSLAAAITQDLMRNGNASSWLDSSKILNVLQTLADMCSRHIDIAERMEIAYKEASETNKALLQALTPDNIPLKQSMMGLVRSVDEEKFLNFIRNTVDNSVDAKIYSGEESIPSDLIGNRQRRQEYFPAISETVISRFLDSKRHEFRSWGLQKEGRVLETKSYIREGMDQRQFEFFSEITYINTTDNYFKFNHPNVGNFIVMHSPSRGVPESKVRQELNSFMYFFTKNNKQYTYSHQSKSVISIT